MLPALGHQSSLLCNRLSYGQLDIAHHDQLHDDQQEQEHDHHLVHFLPQHFWGHHSPWDQPRPTLWPPQKEYFLLQSSACFWPAEFKKNWKECARVPFIGLICWTEYMAAIRPDVNHYVINGSTVNAWNLQMMVIPTEAHPLILIFLFNFSNLLRMFWVNKIFGWRASPTLFVPQILFTEFWVKGSEKNIIQELNFLFRNNMPKVADSVSFINESVPQLK